MIAFLRPRKQFSRLGDLRRIWYSSDKRFKIVETDTIGGVSLGVHYHAIALTEQGESLISRHRKRGAAMRAVQRAANPRKKVRR